MTISASFLLLVIAHLCGDFFFQSEKMVENKGKSFKLLLLHVLIYTAFIAGALIWFEKWWVILIGCTSVGLSHLFIDWLKTFIEKRISNADVSICHFLLFLADQIIHITVLFAISFAFKSYNFIGENVLVSFYSYIGITISLNHLLVIIFSICFLTMPSSVLVRTMFGSIFSFPYERKRVTQTNRAGGVIGVLERITIYLVCALLGWYEIIPAVIAIKAIARFKKFDHKINGDGFTEKFLVGTFTSLVLAILCVVFTNVVK